MAALPPAPAVRISGLRGGSVAGAWATPSLWTAAAHGGHIRSGGGVGAKSERLSQLATACTRSPSRGLRHFGANSMLLALAA